MTTGVWADRPSRALVEAARRDTWSAAAHERCSRTWRCCARPRCRRHRRALRAFRGAARRQRRSGARARGAPVSHRIGAGHVCIDLREAAGRIVLPGVDDPAATMTPVVAPALGPWLAGAAREPRSWASPGTTVRSSSTAPGRLYLHRYWRYERIVAADLHAARRRRGSTSDEGDCARRPRGVSFRNARMTVPTGSSVAAATAVLRRLCVVSGGPGTGKTTTVVRILALLPGQRRPICASRSRRRPGSGGPHGRGRPRGQRQNTARRCGARTHSGRGVDAAPPARRAARARAAFVTTPSACCRSTLLVVDEASMIDLALMAKLVAALPPRAQRPVVLGDRDQLASVEAGAVLGDLCGDVRRGSPTDSAAASNGSRATGSRSDDASRRRRSPTPSCSSRGATASRPRSAHRSSRGGRQSRRRGDRAGRARRRARPRGSGGARASRRRRSRPAPSPRMRRTAQVQSGAALADAFAAFRRFRRAVRASSRTVGRGDDEPSRGGGARRRMLVEAAHGLVPGPPRARHAERLCARSLQRRRRPRGPGSGRGRAASASRSRSRAAACVSSCRPCLPAHEPVWAMTVPQRARARSSTACSSSFPTRTRRS